MAKPLSQKYQQFKNKESIVDYSSFIPFGTNPDKTHVFSTAFENDKSIIEAFWRIISTEISAGFDSMEDFPSLSSLREPFTQHSQINYRLNRDQANETLDKLLTVLCAEPFSPIIPLPHLEYNDERGLFVVIRLVAALPKYPDLLSFAIDNTANHNMQILQQIAANKYRLALLHLDSRNSVVKTLEEIHSADPFAKSTEAKARLEKYITRPTLRKLTQNGIVLHFQSSNGNEYKHFASIEFLNARMTFLKSRVNHLESTFNFEEYENNKFKGSHPPVLEPILREYEAIWRILNEKDESKRATAIQTAINGILSSLKRHGTLYEALHGTKIPMSNTTLLQILNEKKSSVLACPGVYNTLKEYSENDLLRFGTVFLLHYSPDCIQKAIKLGTNLFHTANNIYLLLILENILGLRTGSTTPLKIVDRRYQTELKNSLGKMYLSFLPTMRRAQIRLLGGKITREERIQIRKQYIANQIGPLVDHSKTKELRLFHRANQQIIASAQKVAGTRVAKPPLAKAIPEQSNSALVSAENIRKVLKEIEAIWNENKIATYQDLINSYPRNDRKFLIAVLKAVDNGSPRTHQIIKIPSSGEGAIYASRNQIMTDRAQIIKMLGQKIDTLQNTVKRTQDKNKRISAKSRLAWYLNIYFYVTKRL